MEESESPEMSLLSRELQRAVRNGSETMVRLLLWTGACVNERDSSGQTALHLACESPEPYDTEGITDVLLAYGAEVNARTKRGRTPLHEACSKTNRSAAEALVANGAKVGVVDYYGRTPLHELANAAMHTGAICAMVHALLQKSNSNPQPDSSLNSPYDYENEDIVVAINLHDFDGNTALHLACEKNNKDVVILLLRNGAKVNAKNNTGMTPLHMACRYTYWNVRTVVGELLRFGAEVDVKNEKGRTPLHEACRNMNKSAAAALRRSGARIDVVDDDGWTPLLITCYMCRNSAMTSVVEALLVSDTAESGEEKSSRLDSPAEVEDTWLPVNLRNCNGNTALHLASRKNNPFGCPETIHQPHQLAKSGKEKSSRLDFPAEHEDTKLAVNLRNCNGNTALHLASRKNNKEVVCLLLRKGACVGLKNDCGRTALHLASEACAADVVEVLLDSGEDVNAQDLQANTPLHLVCYMSNSNPGKGKTVNILLGKGADISLKNVNQKTPYQQLY